MGNLLETAVPFILAFVFIGILLGAGAIAMTGLSQSSSTTVNNEVFNGTSGTSPTLTQSDVVSVTSFQLATRDSLYNDTLTTGNNSSVINLNDNFISTPNYTTLSYNISLVMQLANESVLATLVDSCNGNYTLATGINNFIGFGNNCLTDPYTLSVISNSTMYPNTTNITNFTINYSYWAASTAYSVGADGSLTPSADGVFRVSYTYSAVASNALQGAANFSAQMPSIGTVAGVALIIIILFLAVGTFVLSRRG